MVGRVLAALEAAGMADDTLVMVTSDNGGLWHWWDFVEPDDVAAGRITPRGEYVKGFGHQSNAQLRGTKADIWEGGHRVPLIARWPKRILPSRTSDALVELTDLLATCAELVGAPLPDDAGEDSFSLLPVLLDRPPTGPVREAAVHHSLRGTFAVREGAWKLVLGRGSGGFSVPRAIEPAEGEPAGQLYHLARDPQETKNLWLDHPDVVARLTSRLERYQHEGRSRPAASNE